MNDKLNKYPRTMHLEGSKLQPGDEGMGGITLDSIDDDLEWIIEEKVDGANSGFQFNNDLNLLLNSRGTILSSDRNALREDDWKLFKDYANFNEDKWLNRFENRYHIYGEWMGIVHSVFYDKLPHYFLEFDIMDKETNEFLSWDRRLELLEDMNIQSVPILYRGKKPDIIEIRKIASGKSFFQNHIKTQCGDEKPNWQKNLKKACDFVGDNFDTRIEKLVKSDMMEGVYIKLEKDGKVVNRLKFVNKDFTQTIENASEHWQSRFPVPNMLGHKIIEFPQYLSTDLSAGKIYNPEKPSEWNKQKINKDNIIKI